MTSSYREQNPVFRLLSPARNSNYTKKIGEALKIFTVLLFLEGAARGAPTYSDNSTNSTLAGTPVEHRLNWQDAVGLSGYIFSFCNGTYSAIQTYNWTSTDQEAGTRQFKGTYTYNVTANRTPGNWGKTYTQWSNPSYIQASDQNRVTEGTQYQCEDWYNFSYNVGQSIVPSTSTINGIQFTVEASRATSGTQTANMNISNNGGATYKPGCTISRASTTDSNTTCGSYTQLWGFTWTPAMINDQAGSGLMLISNRTSATGNNIRFDAMWVSVNFTDESYESNKSWFEYSSIDGDNYENVDLVKVMVTIDSYNPSASNTTYSNNNRPDIEVGMWDGSQYVNEFYCQIQDTMGDELPNATDTNCTITTTDATIRNAWETSANRKVQIRGIWIDTNNTAYDEINVTGVYGYVDAWNTTSGLCSDANAVLTNDSWAAFTSEMCSAPYTDCWSNVTKLVNSTIGATIKWCVYANDTLNNWNSASCSDPFVYLTRGEELVVSFTITLPSQDPVYAAEGGNATADIEFNLTGGNTASNVVPCLAGTATCQDPSPIFRFDNTGTATLSWYIYLDSNLPASMTLKGNTTNSPVGAATITSSGWLVASSIAPSGSQNAWLWTDFSGASVSDATDRNLISNTTSS
jgi:hypothetical protein